MRNLLIDSDVLIDVFAERTPFFEHSGKLISACAVNRFNGFVTPLCVANCFYVMRKVKGSEKSRQDLRFVLEFLDILTMNRAIVLDALNSGFADFEDALQYTSALHNRNIDAIVTRNTDDFSPARIPVMTPEHFLKITNAPVL